MTVRPVVAGALALALVLFAPAVVVHASADEALDRIDDIIHEWEDGALDAEEALEMIDEIIHDLPAAERNDLIRAVDAIVHDWEDGVLTADEALEMIDDLLHGRTQAAPPAPGTVPAPATTGSGGLQSSSGVVSVALLALAAVSVVGGARLVAQRVRR